MEGGASLRATSPLTPLPSGRGERKVRCNCCAKGCLAHGIVRDVQHRPTVSAKKCIPLVVRCPTLGRVVDATVNLNGDAMLDAIEVQVKTTKGVLSTELEAQHASISQDRPSQSFGGRLVASQLARDVSP